MLICDERFEPVHFIASSSGVFLTQVQDLLAPFPDIAGGYYANVGKLDSNLKTFLENELELTAFSSSTRIPLAIGYHTPETLGADRLATALGAFSLYPDKNVLVLDFGTCLKCDFVSATRKYEGGSISPGLTMRFKALHTFTEKLPLLSRLETFPKELIGRSTAESIQHGVLWGMLAEATETIRLYEEKYAPLTVLVTGGDAKVFEGHLKNAIFVHQNLALLGLAETKKYNANFPNEE